MNNGDFEPCKGLKEDMEETLEKCIEAGSEADKACKDYATAMAAVAIACAASGTGLGAAACALAIVVAYDLGIEYKQAKYDSDMACGIAWGSSESYWDCIACYEEKYGVSL